jgi:hypothetical protein
MLCALNGLIRVCAVLTSIVLLTIADFERIWANALERQVIMAML